MGIFSYKARARDNSVQAGKIAAFNENDAIRLLGRKGLNLISISNHSDSIEYKVNSLLMPVSSKDIVIFSRELSIMMMSSVPIVEALSVITEQTNNLKFKNILSNIQYQVDNGSLLSDALKDHHQLFSDFYCNVVRAGETSGKLDEVLQYLADEVEKDYDLLKRLKGALIYPAFIVSGLFVVGLIFLFFVLPELTKILQETGAQLPLSTRVVIFVANFLQNYYLVILITLILLMVALRFLSKTEAGRRKKDLLLINTPILGKIFQLVYLVRFSRSLKTLLHGGVSVTKSLEIVGDIVRNSVYKDVIDKTIKDINEGGSIVGVLSTSKYVPRMITEMMMVGEKTGRLDEVLEDVAKFYDKEVSNKLSNLSTILEPVIMVVMGLGVGIMVAAVIMPMYNIASQF